MRIVYFLIAISTFLVACKKKTETDFAFKVNVKDLSYNNGLAEASIKVYKMEVGQQTETFVKSVQTDANGVASFDILRDRFTQLRFVVEKDGYFVSEKVVNFTGLSVEKENDVAMETTGKSWVAIRILHTASTNTEMQTLRLEGKINCLECCPSTTTNYVGLQDTTIYCINDANKPYKMMYNVIGGNSGTETVTAQLMDTSTLTIQY